MSSPEEPQVSAGDLEPEAASGVVEELRDEATVASLEDQKIKLIALLSAFDGNPEGLADQFETVRNAMQQAGVQGAPLLSLRFAMMGDASNYEKAVDVVNRSFNMLEQAKKKEVVTDASRALAGEVQQGGPAMDVPPAPPKPPAPAPPAHDAEKTEAFALFKKELSSDAIAQLKDPELGFLEVDDNRGGTVKVEKWENWNEWTQNLLTERGVPKMKNFDLKSVKPRTQEALLEYTRKKFFEASGQKTYQVSAKKAKRVKQGFATRWNNALKRFNADEQEVFTRAFDGWMENALGKKGFDGKKYAKDHGMPALQAMAKAFVHVPGSVDLKSMQPEELVRLITKSRSLKVLVENAGDSNPASMRQLMAEEQDAANTADAESALAAARSVLGSVSSASPPDTESDDNQIASLEAMGLMETVSKPKPDAEDAPGAEPELLPPEPKKGKPKGAAVRSTYGTKQWFKHDEEKDGALTEADALSTLQSVMGSDHAKHKNKYGKHAADLNRYYRVIEMITGTGGRPGRVRSLEGPLHHGMHQGGRAKYPRTVDSQQNILSLMQSLTQQFQIPGVRSKADEQIANRRPHQRSMPDRIALFKALEQKQSIQMPEYWREIVQKRDTQTEQGLSRKINALWSKMNTEMQATPLSYMDLMQKHAHSVAKLDRIVSAIHGGVGGDANSKGDAKIQRQFQLLPVAVKAAKKASLAYDKATSKFSDFQLKTLYEVPAAKKGGQVPHTPMSGGIARARSPMVEASRGRSLSPGARPARPALSRTRSPSPVIGDLTDDERRKRSRTIATICCSGSCHGWTRSSAC